MGVYYTPIMLQRHGYLSLVAGLVDPANRNKVLGLNLTALTPGAGGAVSQTLTIPPGSTTLVGTGLTQTLTGKTITAYSNVVASDSLKTSTGTYVSVTGSTPTAAGQVLTSTGPTAAIWQAPGANTTFLFNGEPIGAGFKLFYGRAQQTSFLTGTFTIFLTNDGQQGGTRLFTDPATIHIQVTVARPTSLSITSSAVVRSINTTDHSVTFYVANVGTIFLGIPIVLFYTVAGY